MQAKVIKILERIKNLKVAVYGDFCLDVYLMMSPEGSEVSVETGLRARAVKKYYSSPGGAANIVANIAALHPKSLQAIGVIGEDMHGRELLNHLQVMGVDVRGLTLQKHHFNTYTFTKLYCNDREEPRIDFGFNNKRTIETDAAILKRLEIALEDCDVLVFNQQVPGSITNPKFITRANQLFAAFKDKIVLLDSRHYSSQFENTYLKINEIEVAKRCGRQVAYQDHITMEDIRNYGQKVFLKNKKPLFITCGDRGIVVVDSTGISTIPGVLIHSKIDAVGAGDTTLSALALCLGAGFSNVDAAGFANLAAAVTIQKLFTTGTASGKEILDLIRGQ